MVETVGAVFAVFLDAHVGTLADFIEVWRFVTDECDAWENIAVAVDEYDAICITFERAFADADVFLVREKF